MNAGQGDTPKYIGPGSCAATSCHGSVKPVADSRILQNEYSTWIIKDKHSKAYQALTGEIGERMARILKLGAKAEESPKCLACHALNTTAAQRGRPFEIGKACPAKTAMGRLRRGWGRTPSGSGRMKNPGAGNDGHAERDSSHGEMPGVPSRFGQINLWIMK